MLTALAPRPPKTGSSSSTAPEKVHILFCEKKFKSKVFCMHQIRSKPEPMVLLWLPAPAPI